LRAADERLCARVAIGVNERSQKKLLATEDRVRESKQSWRVKRRGLAVGGGTLGLRTALWEIYPETRQRRYWCICTGLHSSC